MVHEKLKTSGVFNSNFELKVQKHDSHFTFSQTISIHVDNVPKYTQQSQKVYFILIHLMLISEGVGQSKNE